MKRLLEDLLPLATATASDIGAVEMDSDVIFFDPFDRL
jgi:hypothetical protein